MKSSSAEAALGSDVEADNVQAATLPEEGNGSAEKDLSRATGNCHASELVTSSVARRNSLTDKVVPPTLLNSLFGGDEKILSNTGLSSSNSGEKARTEAVDSVKAFVRSAAAMASSAASLTKHGFPIFRTTVPRSLKSLRDERASRTASDMIRNFSERLKLPHPWLGEMNEAFDFSTGRKEANILAPLLIEYFSGSFPAVLPPLPRYRPLGYYRRRDGVTLFVLEVEINLHKPRLKNAGKAESPCVDVDLRNRQRLSSPSLQTEAGENRPKEAGEIRGPSILTPAKKEAALKAVAEASPARHSSHRESFSSECSSPPLTLPGRCSPFSLALGDRVRWRIYRRYSHFDALRTELKKINSGTNVQSPEFPRKEYLFAADYHSRLRQLATWLSDFTLSLNKCRGASAWRHSAGSVSSLRTSLEEQSFEDSRRSGGRSEVTATNATTWNNASSEASWRNDVYDASPMDCDNKWQQQLDLLLCFLFAGANCPEPCLALSGLPLFAYPSIDYVLTFSERQLVPSRISFKREGTGLRLVPALYRQGEPFGARLKEVCVEPSRGRSGEMYEHEEEASDSNLADSLLAEIPIDARLIAINDISTRSMEFDAILECVANASAPRRLRFVYQPGISKTAGSQGRQQQVQLIREKYKQRRMSARRASQSQFGTQTAGLNGLLHTMALGPGVASSNAAYAMSSGINMAMALHEKELERQDKSLEALEIKKSWIRSCIASLQGSVVAVGDGKGELDDEEKANNSEYRCLLSGQDGPVQLVFTPTEHMTLRERHMSNTRNRQAHTEQQHKSGSRGRSVSTQDSSRDVAGAVEERTLCSYPSPITKFCHPEAWAEYSQASPIRLLELPLFIVPNPSVKSRKSKRKSVHSGDYLIMVNGELLTDKTFHEALGILQTARKPTCLIFLRNNHGLNSEELALLWKELQSDVDFHQRCKTFLRREVEVEHTKDSGASKRHGLGGGGLDGEHDPLYKSQPSQPKKDEWHALGDCQSVEVPEENGAMEVEDEPGVWIELIPAAGPQQLSLAFQKHINRELKAAMRSISDLATTNRDLTIENTHLNEEIQSLESRLQAKREEIENLQMLNVDVQERLRETEKEVVQARGENKQLKNQVVKMDADAARRLHNNPDVIRLIEAAVLREREKYAERSLEERQQFTREQQNLIKECNQAIRLARQQNEAIIRRSEEAAEKRLKESFRSQRASFDREMERFADERGREIEALAQELQKWKDRAKRKSDQESRRNSSVFDQPPAKGRFASWWKD